MDISIIDCKFLNKLQANFSFSGAFTPTSKLIVCLVMLRGRHRGLPNAIDRAVMLPNEFKKTGQTGNDDYDAQEGEDDGHNGTGDYEGQNGANGEMRAREVKEEHPPEVS